MSEGGREGESRRGDGIRFPRAQRRSLYSCPAPARLPLAGAFVRLPTWSRALAGTWYWVAVEGSVGNLPRLASRRRGGAARELEPFHGLFTEDEVSTVYNFDVDKQGKTRKPHHETKRKQGNGE